MTSKLLMHPIEPHCKITCFNDWENDIWDKIDNDTNYGSFYGKVNHEFDRYELP